MEQRQEMTRYGIDFGREVLEMIRTSPLDYDSSQRTEDINWLERKLNEANQLLDRFGESNPETVLQMRIVVKLNGILCKKYSAQLNSESGRKTR